MAASFHHVPPSGSGSLGNAATSHDFTSERFPIAPVTVKHYYVAVDRQQFKMETLKDLLDVLSCPRGTAVLPAVLLCNSRDAVDALLAATSTLPGCTAAFLISTRPTSFQCIF
eukprot:TRINITY_DN3918_c0_g2_i1.p1 TRINITY_DN3918_c0_g2~~TRINITY_DN3918_c0_g2_i1.p1  ORF type:complete len:113 (+),score=7.50 TRINITY_DN3918_c0_g2_i1:217-555(+)